MYLPLTAYPPDFTVWLNYVLEVGIELEGTTVGRSAEMLAAAQTADTTKLYSTLNTSRQETRILYLNAGKMEDPISGDLRTVSLANVLAEPYEALSYCWGSAGQTSQVMLRSESMNDGISLSISVSLHQALVHLRPEVGPPRRLWIDAISINQADTEERSQQVTLMSLVYTRAERVVIWLGVQDIPTKRECISRFKSIQSRLQHEYNGSKKYTREEMDALEFRCIDPDIPLDHLIGFSHAWRGCDFDWFRRTWVLQEVSNAREAVVCCGPDTIRWSSFAAVARRMLDATRGSPLIRYGVMPALFFDLADRRLDDEKGSIDGVKHRDDILSVLIKAHSLKATDPRDKVFALLQFGQETHDLKALPALIRPDYHKPAQRVFTDLVRWWIVEHKSLRILSAVHTLQWRSWHKMYQIDPPAHEYPSWCPDLEHGGEANWAKATLGLNWGGGATGPSYAASAALTPDLELINLPQDASVSEHDTLRLRGRRICTIGEQIIPFPYWALQAILEKRERDRQQQQQPPTEADEEEADAISGLVEAFSHIFDPAAMKRVWLLDRDNQEVQTASDQGGSPREPRFLALHFTYHNQAGFRRGSPDIPCSTPCMFRAAGAGGAGAAAPPPSRSLQHERIGLCPHRARPGDLVVVLHGGLVPYVLREAGEGAQASPAPSGDNISCVPRRYEFVGECYLHGYMHGRAVEEARAAGEQSEIFDLV